MSLIKGYRVAVVLTFLTSACMAELAPAYDESIATGLVSANTSMHVLFASVGYNVSNSTYPKRADDYNKVIGEFNALAIQAKSRPLPPTDMLTKVNAVLTQNSSQPFDSEFSSYPSARAMHDAADTLTHMRDADQKSGLVGNEVTAFEAQANIFVTQAITYENFLKR